MPGRKGYNVFRTVVIPILFNLVKMNSGTNMRDKLMAESLSIQTLHSLAESKRFDEIEALVFQFLNQRFGGDDFLSRSQERDHLAGFCGIELRKWREMPEGSSKWIQVLQRCDSTPALKAYLVKCLRNYMAAEVKRDQAEKYAQRRRIRKILQKEPYFHVRNRPAYRDYGLQIWTEDPQQRGEFFGNPMDPRISEKCGKLPAFRRQSQRYRKKDLIRGCECFLEAIDAYARAYMISEAVEAYWAPCTVYDVAFHDTDLPEQAETRRILREEAFELIGEFISGLSDDQLHVLRVYSVRKFYDETVSSMKVAKAIGCSHGTVCNRHNEVKAELQDWLSRLERSDRVQVCKFLMEYFEKPGCDPLSPVKTINNGENI